MSTTVHHATQDLRRRTAAATHNRQRAVVLDRTKRRIRAWPQIHRLIVFLDPTGLAPVVNMTESQTAVQANTPLPAPAAFSRGGGEGERRWPRVVLSVMFTTETCSAGSAQARICSTPEPIGGSGSGNETALGRLLPPERPTHKVCRDTTLGDDPQRGSVEMFPSMAFSAPRLTPSTGALIREKAIGCKAVDMAATRRPRNAGTVRGPPRRGGGVAMPQGARGAGGRC